MHAIMEREEAARTREEREKYCHKCKNVIAKEKLLDMIVLIFFTDFKYCLSIKKQSILRTSKYKRVARTRRERKGKKTLSSLLSSIYLCLFDS